MISGFYNSQHQNIKARFTIGGKSTSYNMLSKYTKQISSGPLCMERKQEEEEGICALECELSFWSPWVRKSTQSM